VTGCRRRRHDLDRVGGQRAEVGIDEDHLLIDAHPGVVQEVLGDGEELVGAPVDGVQHAGLLVGQRRLVVEEELDEAANRRQRGAQLVRNGGDHVVFDLGEFAEAVVLLDEDLGRFALTCRVQSFALALEMLALGDVVGDDERSRTDCRRRAGG